MHVTLLLVAGRADIFDARLPLLLKTSPSTFYDHIYPSRGPKTVAGCTPRAYRDHSKLVFELPAQPPAQVLCNPDPSNLPLSADYIRSALEGPFKGNKSSGPSPLPSQLVKHLHARNDQAISILFHKVTTSAIPSQWNTTWLTPIFKKVTDDWQATTGLSARWGLLQNYMPRV